MNDLLNTGVAAFGTVAALVFLTWLGLWLWDRADTLPPPRPPERLPRAGNAERDALLTYPAMKKRTGPKPEASTHQRPTDVTPDHAADQAVLPPPRPIEGRSGKS